MCSTWEAFWELWTEKPISLLIFSILLNFTQASGSRGDQYWPEFLPSQRFHKGCEERSSISLCKVTGECHRAAGGWKSPICHSWGHGDPCPSPCSGITPDSSHFCLRPVVSTASPQLCRLHGSPLGGLFGEIERGQDCGSCLSLPSL